MFNNGQYNTFKYNDTSATIACADPFTYVFCAATAAGEGTLTGTMVVIPSQPTEYQLEVHIADGSLVGIVREFWDATLEQSADSTPDVLRFKCKVDDEMVAYFTPAYEVWVRNIKDGSVISRCVVLFKEDEH